MMKSGVLNSTGKGSELLMHELTESYVGAKQAIQNGVSTKNGCLDYAKYLKAHNDPWTVKQPVEIYGQKNGGKYDYYILTNGFKTVIDYSRKDKSGIPGVQVQVPVTEKRIILSVPLQSYH